MVQEPNLTPPQDVFKEPLLTSKIRSLSTLISGKSKIHLLVLMNLNSAGTTVVITPKVKSSLPIQPVIPPQATGSTETNLHDPELESNTARHILVIQATQSLAPQECHLSSKVTGKDIWTEWFMHHSTKYLRTPPPNCPGHLQNHTLFVLVNPDIEADIRARRPPEVVGLPPKLLQCLTVWVWKDSLQGWQTIQYGDVEIINGEQMALSLGGISGIEPCWIPFLKSTYRLNSNLKVLFYLYRETKQSQ
ncbi:hypothetical protein BDP27DRAFT_1368510 [Rhodocollybia butyracea]|uniref:Uncharacterized protein n=1 Tax=Rhodocollybia butyracea TaxID=206335 RepID=A0A9P5PD07_9AGAR|nr:hypothetical protein BDP27DRAFT_1368510 [Rhodocollybia butyracea]